MKKNFYRFSETKRGEGDRQRPELFAQSCGVKGQATQSGMFGAWTSGHSCLGHPKHPSGEALPPLPSTFAHLLLSTVILRLAPSHPSPTDS